MNVIDLDRARTDEAENTLIRLTAAASDLAMMPLTADAAREIAQIARQIEEVTEAHRQ